MNTWHNQDTDLLCEAILNLKTVDEVYAFLEDVCTIKEIKDISQRLRVAKMLSSGISYLQISRETGASTATISRVSRCLEYGAGGYDTVLRRTDKEQNT
ncbi:MAG: DNA-binding transcriptional regulator [Clostridia bacterium]|nr:DNA-binding transcriptional regulator [Clostridia bacterium]